MRIKHIVILMVIVVNSLNCYGLQEDKVINSEIESVFAKWINYVNSKNIKGLLELYDEKAILHPTLSAEIRDSKKKKERYFENLFALPTMTVAKKQYYIRAFNDDVAINSGFYEFTYIKDGKKTIIPARFSFTYVKKGGKWLIADHHSSQIDNLN